MYVVFITVYVSACVRTYGACMEEYWRALGDQVAVGGSNKLVIGRDFNANVWRRNTRLVYSRGGQTQV